MKLIVDIPTYHYERIKEYYDALPAGSTIVAEKCYIADGIPLPKGHGRLIDADAFIKEKTKIYCENCDRRRGMSDGKLTEHFVYDIGDAPCRACDIGDMIDYVDDAPTIIEADMERSNHEDSD